jgi:hypothetical protein
MAKNLNELTVLSRVSLNGLLEPKNSVCKLIFTGSGFGASEMLWARVLAYLNGTAT